MRRRREPFENDNATDGEEVRGSKEREVPVTFEEKDMPICFAPKLHPPTLQTEMLKDFEFAKVRNVEPVEESAIDAKQPLPKVREETVPQRISPQLFNRES